MDHLAWPAPGGVEQVAATPAEQAADVADVARSAWAALMVAAVIPIGTLAGYFAVGSPSSLFNVATRQLQRDGGDAEQAAQTSKLADRLKAKLAAGTNDPEEWVLLARTYRASGNTDAALQTYKLAAAHDPPVADVLIEYASALVDQNGKRFDETVDGLVARALTAQPDNLNALAMAGAGAMQRGNRELALKHWRRLQELIPQPGEDRDRAARLVALASGQAPTPAQQQPGVKTPSPVREAAAGRVSGVVSVADTVRPRLPASATLFVFARAVEGPAMPVAVLRLNPNAYPVAFSLDDTHSMLEGTKLSSFGDLRLVARISAQGNATRRPGDLEGTLDAVKLGAGELRLVVDHVVD